MIVYKCKMCGGDLAITEGSKIATCEYCMSQQTIPSTDDEKRANLFNRANHFRQNGEFDRALGIYEQILADGAGDAEVYWELVLCKLGIQYVEDPATKERKPTVNRTQITSILSDPDYRKALELAEAERRELYEREAMEIDRIQKEILSIAQSEEAYDVFISYKEKARDGNRTLSSVIAQNIYERLTKEGYRTFFSRITLEDVIGKKYEPYIFSALNSAKVMLVIGTSREEFEAPWVRNEWSRFLNMMRGSLDKFLIPCFRDLDAYDLPEEFQSFQAQDMSKIGFEQDLLRGIGKIIPIRKEVQPDFARTGSKTSYQEKTVISGALTIGQMIENGNTLMGLQDYQEAFNTFKQVTQNRPGEPEGWWGLIRAVTKDFSLMDYKLILEKEKELHNWYGRVTKLAKGEQLRDFKQRYLSFWKSFAGLEVKEEVSLVEGMIKKYEQDAIRLDQDKTEAVDRITQKKKHEENKENAARQQLAQLEGEKAGLKEEIHTYEKKKKKGWGMIIASIVLSFGAAILPLFSIVPMVLFWAGVISLFKLRGYSVDVKRTELRDLEERIYNSRHQAESVKVQDGSYEKEMEKAQKSIDDKITAAREKIKLCKTYLETDENALLDLLYALDCQKCGEAAEINADLLELRKKVLAK